MAYPTGYNRGYSFTDFQASNPEDPLPGNRVDIELNSIETTLDAIIAFIQGIARSDGEIANDSIGLAQMSGTLIALGIDRPTTWLTTTAYVVDDSVFESSKLYVCLVAHTSGVFATDLAAAKWVEVVDFTGLVTDAAAEADAAAASAAAAAASAAAAAAFFATAASTTVQGTVELATDAETIALADTSRAVTPSNLQALENSARTFQNDNTHNTSATDVLTLRHITSNVPAAGMGAAIAFAAETSSGNNEVGMSLQAVTTDVTGGSEDFDFVCKLMAAGAAYAEKFRVTSDGKVKLITGAVLDFASGDVTITHSANTLTVAGGDLVVPDEAYDATGWNGDLSVPTKNAVRDKIESLTAAPTVVRKAAGESVTSSTTLQDDDDFSFAVLANTNYYAEFDLFLSSGGAAADGGFKFDFTGPAAPDSVSVISQISAGPACTDAMMALATAFSSAITYGPLSSGSYFEGVRIKLYVNNGANAGTVQLRWAQGTSDGTATTVAAGSLMKYQVVT